VIAAMRAPRLASRQRSATDGLAHNKNQAACIIWSGREIGGEWGGDHESHSPPEIAGVEAGAYSVMERGGEPNKHRESGRSIRQTNGGSTENWGSFCGRNVAGETVRGPMRMGFQPPFARPVFSPGPASGSLRPP